MRSSAENGARDTQDKQEGTCSRPQEHQEHLCHLKKVLSRGELEPLLKNPKYVCANCGGRVHSGRNLCLPRRIRQ